MSRILVCLFVSLVTVGEAAVAARRPCVDGDWKFGFSECVEDDVGRISRDLFAYSPGSSTCNASHPSSRRPPEPLLGQPCQELCQAGTHLAVDLRHTNNGTPAMSVGCRRCRPGSFSLGGGTLVDGGTGDWARPWPEGLSTFCYYRGSDYKWHFGGGAPLLCVLHLRRPRGGPAGGEELLAETRPGTWNAQLADRELDLPVAIAPGDTLACKPPSAAEAARLRGAAVMVLRGACTFQTKTEVLAAAGALAVILYNNLPRAGFFYPAAANRSRLPRIPIFMVTQEIGLQWRRAAEQAAGAAAPRVHVPSTRCSDAAREALPVGGAPSVRANTSAEAVQRDSWDEVSRGHHACAPWTADPTGRVLHSGNNLRNHWIYSVLTLSIRFVRDGHLTFRYSVDAEDGFDGLAFQVDQVEQMNLTSRRSPYHELEVKVSRGVHTFTWVYAKDFGTTAGEDRARLQLLETVGTGHYDAECRECRGASRPGVGCEACKGDSYLDIRSRSCLPCPAGTSSPPGSLGRESCIARRACTRHDMQLDYLALETANRRGVQRIVPGASCRGNRSLVRYTWRKPMMCSSSRAGSASLPKDAVGPCPPCQPFESRPRGAECEPVARRCPDGTHGVREKRIVHWNYWPSNVSTETWGPPGGSPSWLDSWQLAFDGSAAVVGGSFLGSARPWGHAQADVALLHLDVALDSPGRLSFHIEPRPANAWGRLARLSLNGTPATGGVFGVEGRPSAQVVTLSLPQGITRITWSWHYQVEAEAVDFGSETEVMGLRLTNVSITHAVGAGVSRCEACPAGSEPTPGGASCRPCPAGRSTGVAPGAAVAGGAPAAGTSRCLPCPTGWAAGPGAASCRRCGPGLKTDEAASRCMPLPAVHLPGRDGEPALQWDVGALVEAWRKGTWAKAAGGLLSGNGSLRSVQVEGRHYHLGLFSPGPWPEPKLFGGGGASVGLAYWWEYLPPRDALDGRDGALGAAVCRDAGGEVRSVAETLDSIQPTARGGEGPGLWASFSGTCGPGGRVRRAGVHFRCDSTALWQQPGNLLDAASAEISASAHGVPDVRFVEGQRPASPRGCNDIAIEWRTSFACPLCRPEDFHAVAVSDCQAGKGRKIGYIYRAPCRGGFVPPEPYWEPCGQATFVAVAVTVPVLLLLCVLGSYVLILRRRYAKYMVLGEGQGGAVAPAQIGASGAA